MKQFKSKLRLIMLLMSVGVVTTVFAEDNNVSVTYGSTTAYKSTLVEAIQYAISNATADCTIKVLATNSNSTNLDGSSMCWTKSYNLTIDLGDSKDIVSTINGYGSNSNHHSASNYSVLNFLAGHNTIKGYGTLNMTTTTGYGSQAFITIATTSSSSDVSLDVKDSPYLNFTNTGQEHRSIVIADQNSGKSTINIYGGTFTGNSYSVSNVVAWQGNANVYIYGGEFHRKPTGNTSWGGVTDYASNGLYYVYDGYFDGQIWCGDASKLNTNYQFFGGKFTGDEVAIYQASSASLNNILSTADGLARSVSVINETYNGTTYTREISGVLTLDQTSTNNDATIKAYGDKKAVYTTFNNTTLSGDYYNPVCLPFALTAANVEVLFGSNCEIKEITGATISDGKLNVTYNTVTAMEAGKPYMVKPASTITLDQISGRVLAAQTPSTLEFGDIKFVGSYNYSTNMFPETTYNKIFTVNKGAYAHPTSGELLGLGFYVMAENLTTNTVTVNDVTGGTVSGLAPEGKYITGATATLTATPWSSYTFRGWKHATSDTEYCSTDQTYSFTVNEDQTLCPIYEQIHETILAPGVYGDFDVTSSGQYPWEKTTAKSGLAYQSTNKWVNSTTSASTITVNPRDGVTYKLSFNYLVSSESGWDKLTITVANNGSTTTVANAISGAGSEQSYTSGNLTGETTITVSYTKDSSSSSGDDRGYIYNIVAEPTSTEGLIYYCNADYNGEEDAVSTSTNDWESYRGLHKNAIGYTNGTATDKTNVFVKQGDNDFKASKLEVYDGQDFSMPTTLANSTNKVAEEASYSRTHNGNTWGTLCLPFDITVSNGGCEYYDFESVNGSAMKFKKITSGTIKAGTPVIVKKSADIEISGTNVDVVSTASDKDGEYTLHGTLSAMQLTSAGTGEGYFFNGDKFWYTDFANYPTPVAIPAYRAYFTTTSSSAKCSAFIIEAFDGDVTTEIGTIDANGKATFYDGPAYNLAGQQVSKSAKGIVIVNGKKIVR